MALDLEAMAGEVVILLKTAVDPLKERIAELEKTIAALPAPLPDLTPSELASVTDLFRKELGVVPPRMSQRVIRNAAGQIERVLWEPTA